MASLPQLLLTVAEHTVMSRLLVIEVSPQYEYSISRKLTARFLKQWRQLHPRTEVVVRDLATTPLPYIDMAWIMGAFSPPEVHSAESAGAIKISNELIAELKAADLILIGTPMHNLMIPAPLKAYIDHIVRVGLTVTDTNVGMVTGKRAAVLLASGGDFSKGAPNEAFNQATPYLRLVLGFIGITDVQFVHAGPTRPIMERREPAEPFLERFEPQLQAVIASWANSA